MPFRWKLFEHIRLALETARALLLVTPVAILTGCTCALFLWSLGEVTEFFQRTPSLLYVLPIAGIVVAGLYRRFGASSEGGNSLIIEQIHEPGGGVPRRMAPLILVTTLITHLCGGSAGREGTAVQMGGSIASAFAGLYRRRMRFGGDDDESRRRADSDMRLLLMSGVAAGFGGVFGTPLAGAVFALEVLTIGRLSYIALIPCLFAAIVGDWSCTVWGIGHTHYTVAALPHITGARLLDGLLLLKVSIAAVAFGLVSVLFASLTHGIQAASKRLIANALLRPVLGACVLILLTYWLGTRDYLGLGVTAFGAEQITISSCFKLGGATSASWFWKLLFTAVTLGTGFKGGEVTPLFFIGAALGNALAALLGAPVDLLAAIGFAAVFAGATNTPLASTLMAIELFGAEHAIYYATGCFIAYVASGHSSIYSAQRIGEPKSRHWHAHRDKTIGAVHDSKRR